MLKKNTIRSLKIDAPVEKWRQKGKRCGSICNVESWSHIIIIIFFSYEWRNNIHLISRGQEGGGSFVNVHIATLKLRMAKWLGTWKPRNVKKTKKKRNEKKREEKKNQWEKYRKNGKKNETEKTKTKQWEKKRKQKREKNEKKKNVEKRNEMKSTKAYKCHSKNNTLHQRRNNAKEMHKNAKRTEILRNWKSNAK